VDALDRHAPGARSHAEGTATYAFAAAVELGFRRGRAELVRETAKLHEIGKVYVPKDALAKGSADLSSEEAQLLDSHLQAGARLARGAGIPERACNWILALRERFDGTGPGRLRGSAIPVEARVIRAACVCDTAMATPARPPLSPERRSPPRLAADALLAGAGNELDPSIVDAIISLLDRAAAGGP
jgi:HD-GYP domain-containing protein (c-di-GMP phosphodiesterase class II)